MNSAIICNVSTDDVTVYRIPKVDGVYLLCVHAELKLALVKNWTAWMCRLLLTQLSPAHIKLKSHSTIYRIGGKIKTERVNVAVTLQTRIREALHSNLGRESVFSSVSPSKHAEAVPSVGRDRFFPIYHLSLALDSRAVYSLATELN
jgi:hypothetical protein